MQECTHLAQINAVEPSVEGCEECLKMEDTWVHLRECLICGPVCCCDSSKNKHATEHPLAQSFQPGEDSGATWTRWSWSRRSRGEPYLADDDSSSGSKKPEDYERWISEFYRPTVLNLPSVDDWRDYRVGGVYHSGKVEVNDAEQLAKDAETEEMQRLLDELGGYAEVTQLMAERFV